MSKLRWLRGPLQKQLDLNHEMVQVETGHGSWRKCPHEHRRLKAACSVYFRPKTKVPVCRSTAQQTLLFEAVGSQATCASCCLGDTGELGWLSLPHHLSKGRRAPPSPRKEQPHHSRPSDSVCIRNSLVVPGGLG